MKFSILNSEHELTITGRSPTLSIAIDGRVHHVTRHGSHARVREIEMDGTAYQCVLAQDGDTLFVHYKGRQYTVHRIDALQTAQQHGSDANVIRAPMPGTTVSILIQPGAPVTYGDTIVTIESMKLQTNLTAPRDGIIDQIHVQEGDGFDKDAVIVTLKPEAEAR